MDVNKSSLSELF